MTFISVPGTVGKAGFDYFQVVVGYVLGYFVVAFILLPIYYRLKLTSIYTYLDGRLGATSYKTGALFFILSHTRPFASTSCHMRSNLPGTKHTPF